MAGLYGALVALEFPEMLYSGFYLTSIVRAAVLTLATMFAFHFLRRPALAAAAAGVAYAAASVLLVGLRYDVSPMRFFIVQFLLEWVFLAGLAWTTPRLAPLPVALWAGAICPLIANAMVRLLTGGPPIGGEYFWLSLAGAALFAGVLAGVARATQGGTARQPWRSKESI